MTEKINLDELDTGESEDEETGNPGDWLWKGEGSPEEEPEPADEPETTSATDAVPHVPNNDRKKPAGIPKAQGGSGSGTSDGTDPREPQHPEDPHTESRASGPHGGGVDDMTTAYTYEALQRIDDVRLALAETNEWSDWVGIVGEVAAHDINKFQRDRGLDTDFFNGSGSGPAERLADIDEHSMFYAKRMVVVGTEDQEWIADEAGWEFVPLEEAADGAGWELKE